MKNVVIYFFSGTGNTEFVARLLEDNLKARNINVDIVPIDFTGKVEIEAYDTIFIGYPVHGYGMPPIIRQFIETLPEGNLKNVVIFSSFGGLSGGAETVVAKLLVEKGYQPIGYCGILMPKNNPAGSDIQQQPIEKYVASARIKVSHFCQKITEGKTTVRTFSLGNYIIGSRLNKYQISHLSQDFSKKAYTDKKCIYCLKCVKMCPVRNITYQNSQISFSNHCLCCLRCFNNCPVSAIQTTDHTDTVSRYKGPLGDYHPPINPEYKTTG
jgi:flavodoxin/Pyruvate/2-oxoacid:ferredoxin oxidoreductase delta subunit